MLDSIGLVGPPMDQATGGGAIDDELVALAQQDRAAFVALYTRYATPIYRYCYVRLRSREAAEDATSQTFVKALAALHRFHGGSFRGWLFAIAQNVVIDAQRRQRPQASLDDAEPVADLRPTPEDHALATESERSVLALLDHLSPDQRQVVELRLAGLTGPEIAEVLGRRPEAVKSTQFRAYTKLRAMLRRAPGTEESHDEA